MRTFVICTKKLRRMRWIRHVARMGGKIKTKKVWYESVKERNYSEDPGVDGRIILKCMSRKLDRRMWTGFISLRIGTNGRC
jgi:hypothetical protein